jgi:deoxyribonuclease-4
VSDLIIGSHVGVSMPEMLLGGVKATIEYGANAFMFYTGAPQNTLRQPISKFLKEEAHSLMEVHHIQREHVIVHAPYIINLANVENERTRDLAITFLSQELDRVRELGFERLVLHPGSHVGQGLDVGIQAIADGLNEVLEKDQGEVKILLETMAGKGSEVGSTLAELFAIYDRVHHKERIGICLDTCHLHDSGVDIHQDFDFIINQIESKMGLRSIMAVHVNDSKNIRNARKDRHENFGYGEIGFDHLIKVVYHEKLRHVPKILETPWINGFAPYKEEIAMIQAKEFNPKIKEELMAR